MAEENLLLDKIQSPEDLRQLNAKECGLLSKEIRTRVVDVVSQNGGHLASNLGTVELTIALHRVFKTPEDILIWDVGHQCYTHKILTGRNESMGTIRKQGGLSGFPKRSESPHDFMDTGHASTSISSALGMLKARKLQHKQGKAIAIIGDGALTGGMAFEAINHAGHIKDDLIVILNDNDMSIGRNVGALSSRPRPGRISSTISHFTILPLYQNIKHFFDRFYLKIPMVGKIIQMVRNRTKRAFKAMLLKENIFGDLGFDYVGPIKGHNIKQLEKVFRRVKKLKSPVVIHVLTQKGRGVAYAEGDPSTYHGVGAFNIVDGKVDKKSSLTFSECFSSLMVKAGEKESRLCSVTAAMTQGAGLSDFAQNFPDRHFDVGIAEQHAVTFAAGLAAQGMKPVVAIYSTFMQRAVDQVIHDIAIPFLPVIFVMSRSGFVGDDGETHQGLYDIPIFKSIPNLEILAPSGAADFSLLFEYALKAKRPILIRIPKANCNFSSRLNQPVVTGRGLFIHKKKNKTLLISLGGAFEAVEEALNLLARDKILVDHYNLRFVKPLNMQRLQEDFKIYNKIILIEDGSKIGGVGEQMAEFFIKQLPNVEFDHLGVVDTFFAQATRAQLLHQAGLDGKSIAGYVMDSNA